MLHRYLPSRLALASTVVIVVFVLATYASLIGSKAVWAGHSLPNSNVFLHVLVALLAYGLLWRTVGGPAGAMAAALAFALHPVFVEAVACACGRLDMLAAAFSILAVLLHVHGRTAGRVGSAVAFALALLSKESALCVPLLLIAYDLLHRGRPDRCWVGAHAGPVLVLAGYGLFRSIVGVNSTEVLTERGVDLLPGYAFAVGSFLPRLVFPGKIRAFQPYEVPPWPVVCAVLSAVSLLSITLVIAAVRCPRGPTRAAAWGWLWFLLALAPMAVAGEELGIVGDRLAYFPALGVAVMAASGIQAALARLCSPGVPRCFVIAFAIGLGIVWLCLAWATGNRVLERGTEEAARPSLGSLRASDAPLDDAELRVPRV